MYCDGIRTERNLFQRDHRAAHVLHGYSAGDVVSDRGVAARPLTILIIMIMIIIVIITVTIYSCGAMYGSAHARSVTVVGLIIICFSRVRIANSVTPSSLSSVRVSVTPITVVARLALFVYYCFRSLRFRKKRAKRPPGASSDSVVGRRTTKTFFEIT